MKAKKYWILAVLVAGVFAVACWGAGREEERKSLVGLKGCYVAVEIPEHGGKETGLTKQQLRTDVELKLRLAGIKVVSQKEWFNSISRTSFFCVIVDSFEFETLPMRNYYIAASLSQMVSLVRDPTIRISAATWGQNYFGIVENDDFQKEIRKNVKDVVDEFINDYLAANPKPKDEQK